MWKRTDVGSRTGPVGTAASSDWEMKLWPSTAPVLCRKKTPNSSVNPAWNTVGWKFN